MRRTDFSAQKSYCQVVWLHERVQIYVRDRLGVGVSIFLDTNGFIEIREQYNYPVCRNRPLTGRLWAWPQLEIVGAQLLLSGTD
jgi:hypothetical protein